ncbi:FixH family protein [Cytophagaceae bacterium DM2B3-1]|uniref:FixH family protein n=1 Tax=Xanthocytophaga flava TaxID=3048013 RepID=A0ABT7CG73_9BACT|nr:FixH family protein [Xanthocytophaga flavus]MDJ1466687.1 FixH family protein [Xanthocytophaga flavus]MDJ1492683.1 FixH family protein [Xanthocytophaga flavus]
MNWGKGIIITVASFMAFILGLSIYMMSQTPELEEKNYYEKDLVYQQIITARQNAIELNKPVSFSYQKSNGQVVIAFPIENSSLQGTIVFTRPSDASQDSRLPLHPDNHQQVIPVTHLTSGLWRIHIDWTMDGKTYQSQTWEFIK